MHAAKGHDKQQLPLPLRRAEERFRRWRSARRRGTPIPESLWTLAVDLSGVYGVCKTACILKLDYYRLKKRLVEGASAGAAEQIAFLELPPSPVAAGECIIDCENSAGARMRIHLKGVALSDLAALSRSLWSAE